MVEVLAKTFMVVGEKNKGFFKEYAKTVPKAAQIFLQRECQIPFTSGIEVTVYEQPKRQNQLVGTFYVGVLVEEKGTDLPEGMEYIEVQNQYAMTIGKVTEIPHLYSSLDRWINENGYQHATPDKYIIEVYYPVENDVENVEVYIPVVKSFDLKGERDKMSESFLEEIHYFRIPVNNLEKSITWYTEVLGFQLRFTQKDLAVLALKSGPLYVLVEADQDSRGHFTINGQPEFSVGFTTQRITEFHTFLTIKDVQVEPIQEDQGHNFFYFYDPSGNKLQVHN